jgi:hypothetical protein
MATAPKPYWIDDYQGSRHEAYYYGDLDSHVLSVEHDGRSLRVLYSRNRPADGCTEDGGLPLG